MSEERPREEEREERGSRLARLLEALGLAGGGEAEQQQTGLITGIDIKNLITFILEDKRAVEIADEVAKEIEDVLNKINGITREFVDIYVQDGMNRVVHPVYGTEVINTRFSEVVALVRHAIKTLAQRVVEAIDSNAPPEEVHRRARALESFTKLSYLLLMELYARLITLLHINAPPRARPPLVNATLGYEIP